MKTKQRVAETIMQILTENLQLDMPHPVAARKKVTKEIIELFDQQTAHLKLINEQEPKQHVFLIHQDGNTARLYKDGVKVSPEEFTTFYGCEMTPEQKELLRITKKNYFESIQPEGIRQELIKFAQQFYADEETCIHNIDEYLKSKQP